MFGPHRIAGQMGPNQPPLGDGIQKGASVAVVGQCFQCV
jgi:hypothetical protein